MFGKKNHLRRTLFIHGALRKPGPLIVAAA
jgi:hypothetical protein